MKNFIGFLVFLSLQPSPLSKAQALSIIPESNPHNIIIKVTTRPAAQDNQDTLHQTIDFLHKKTSDLNQKLQETQNIIRVKKQEISSLKLRLCCFFTCSSCLFFIVAIGAMGIGLGGWC